MSETQAAIDVLAERQRQKDVEGWTPEHDDQHTDGSMALAGAAYAYGAMFGADDRERGLRPDWWPWDMRWWKPKDRRRDLVRAGALIIAELERLDRIAVAQDKPTP